MKIKVNLESLHLAIKEVEKTANEVIVLNAADKAVHIMASNGVAQTILTLKNSAEEANGNLCLERKTFCSYIHKLACFGISNVELTLTDGIVEVVADKNKATFPVMQTEVVKIETPNPKTEKRTFIIAPNVLKDVVSRGGTCSDKGAQPLTEYVSFNVKEKKIVVTSTSGFNAARCEAELLKDASMDFDFTISMHDAKLLEFNENVRVYVGDKSIIFVGTTKKLLLSRTVITYPDVNKFFDAMDKTKEEGNSAKVDKRELIQTVELLMAVGDGEPVMFNMEEDKIICKRLGATAEISNITSISFNDVGEIAINPVLLKHVSKFGSTEIMMSYLDPVNMIYFDSVEDTGFKFLALPVRIKAEEKNEKKVDATE